MTTKDQRSRRLGALSVALLVLGSAAGADRVIPARPNALRGADSQVDYSKLAELGPWDDRNYRLTRKDLAFLSANEAESILPVPVFFRVEMRKSDPGLPTSGPAQYPRSAVNHYVAKYGGYLIDGVTYAGIRKLDGERYEMSSPVTRASDKSSGLLNLEGSEKRITSPMGASESAVAINPVNPNLVIAATNGPGIGQKSWYSSDGGLTWSGPFDLENTCCDPSVAWSSDGSTAYMTALSASATNTPTSVDFYRSTDNGASWNDGPRLVSGGESSDKEYLHVDTSPDSPYRDHIYIAWHSQNQQMFARSTDRGESFSQGKHLDWPNRGIGSDITSDKNGNVYFFYPTSSRSDITQAIRMLKSVDGGARFGDGATIARINAVFDFPIPAMETRRPFVYVSADVDKSDGPFANSIYVAWTDTISAENNSSASANHAKVTVARSRDGGATWALAVAHSTDDGATVDRFNQWLAVDADGRVFCVFYDTRHSVGRSGTDLYYSVSSDGGVTFDAATRLTAVTSKNIAEVNEWGDYNGMDIIGNKLMAVYTDNRDESGGAAESVDVYGIDAIIPPDDAWQVPAMYIISGGWLPN